MNCEIPESIVSLEVVQKLVAELENRDLRTLPQLPHRVILPGSETALVKSDSGEHYYKLGRSSQGWNCSCKGYKYRAKCKHSTGVMAYLEREEARLQKAVQLLCKEPVAETEAQRYQRLKRQKIAEARRAPAMVDKEMMSTESFKPVVEA